MKKQLISILIAVLSLVAILFTSFYSETVINSFAKNQDRALLGVLFLTAVMFMLSSIVHHTSRLTKLPTFVLAIFIGILAKPYLEPITTNHESLAALVGLGATLILFGGGLDTSLVNFKKLIAKILSLSFLGLFITALFTSFAVYILNLYFSLGISVVTAVLLGAVLASTDPAAIIPILKDLKFKNRSLKDIIVSESAVTDVTGTLLTIIFLALVAKNVSFGSITDWYGNIFTKESGVVLFNQIFWGALLGLIGYFFLQLLSNFKEKKEYGHEADLPFFLFIPIIIFVFALDFGGSGYLAAFIAGLMFHLKEHLKDIEGFFISLVEGFLKPVIFILLGSLVDIKKILVYAPIGIALALVFMFIIRPLAVFISLIFFRYFGKDKLTFRDLFFISFIRETGAIPAVLLVTIVSLQIPETKGLLEIGMWVILSTIIIAPPLTPKVARLLKIVE